MLAAGRRIAGRYEITGSIRSGGMGSVLAGHDTKLDRAVAIKILASARANHERAVQRFLREGRAMARVDHHACVQVFDTGTDASCGPYLVMERLEGEDLSAFLHARGPLAPTLALCIIEQIAAAVQAVHAAGIIHRDLKPGNAFVLRHSPGELPRIKLLDFGIATLSGDDEHLTHPGDVLGTLSYMAPERWLSENDVDARADVYSLGAILHELLSGAPPFRANTRAALELAVLHDPPESLHARRTDLPDWLISVVQRALSKTAAGRYPDVGTFARALGINPPRGEASTPGSREPSFNGTARFRVVRELARTPGAEIYAAVDTERNTTVAMKRLKAPTGENAFRLKSEFRAAAEIHHPNLVRLEALVEEAGELLLIMELIEGRPLLEHLEGASHQLRECFAQLVTGLGALHARGLAHGDVKSENILVEPTGRVVVLDCALASRWGARALVRGTVGYLAPEVLEGRVGPESDFYAAGILLHQALTGRPPPNALLPGQAQVSASDEYPAEAPSDLVQLCSRLRADVPSARPTAEEILRVLRQGGTEGPAAASPPARDTRRSDVFIGRRDTLDVLDHALTQVGQGSPQVVFIEGASGIGKTALLEHFRHRLEHDGKSLVLTGRAREGESIPYPALDEAIDELGTHLLGLPVAVAESLLSSRCAPLAHLFPTLTRVPAIARAATEHGARGEDPARLRHQASEILRDLFKRLCERRAVVLLVDDLQWIDQDSATLLVHVLGGAAPPPLLLVAAVRSGDGGTSSTDLRKLRARLAQVVRSLVLGPLSPADSRELVLARWPGDSPPDPVAAARLARQSGGVPFFVEMLAPGSGEEPHSASARLEDVLALRRQQLAPAARAALDMICLSSRPLFPSLIAGALEIEDARVLDPLFAGSLVRWTRVHNRSAIEPYHNKIREIIQGKLTPTARRNYHTSLARMLRADRNTDPEILVEHLAGSGEAAAASEVALAAARIANEHLAFDRAAALFAVAARHGDHEDDQMLAIYRWQARALEDAGRRREAGDVLLQAALHAADGSIADALQREAGAHLLLSGDVARGLQVLKPALDGHDLQVPATFAETIQATMVALGGLTTRGVVPRAFIEPLPTAAALARIDLCLVLAQGLAHIDLRVLPFACQALQAALDAGEPERLQRACALFVINTVEYLPNPLVGPVLALCRDLTDAKPDPLAVALFETAVAENAHFEADFVGAEAAFERAEETLLRSCPGASRELATARDLAVFVQYAQKGDFHTQLERTQRWLAEAEASRDIFHASMLRVAHAIVWIAQDQPELARSELQRAQAGWSGEGGVLEVAVALYHDIIDRYEERDIGAGDADPMRSSLLRSPAAQTPFLSGYLGLQSAWGGLRAIANGRAGVERAAEIRETVASLRLLGLPLWSAVADALESNLEYLEGAQERAIRRLGQAEEKFRRLHMLCLAACARKRRGQFVGGELGKRLDGEADGALRVLGVTNPTRWTRAYWSMFDVTAAVLRTDDGEGDGAIGANGAVMTSRPGDA